MYKIEKITLQEGQALALSCCMPKPLKGNIWTLKDDKSRICSYAVIEDDGRITSYATVSYLQGQGNMKALLDMLCELHEFLYVNYDVHGPAEAVLLGTGFRPEPGDRYVHRKAMP